MDKQTPRRILLLAANPSSTHPLRLDKEIAAIESGLSLAKNRTNFSIIPKWAVNPIALRRAILDVNPHIVHFSGHGAGEDGLLLESSNDDGSHLVSTEALTNLFALFKDQVECVVLNACYSEVQAEAINRHIDYVVGMNHAIGDEAAIAFSVGFYDGLWAERTVQFAYKLGCNAIQLNSNQQQQIYSQHLIPILKIRSGIEVHSSDEFPDSTLISNTDEINEQLYHTSDSTNKTNSSSESPFISELRPTPTVALSRTEEYTRSGHLQPQHNIQSLTKEFVTGLDDFSDWIESEKIRNALGRQIIRRLRHQEQDIRGRLEDKFSIVVVGDFKRGKSTLVNALLGTQVASTSVTTETVSINEIEYGEVLHIEAHLKDGRTIALNPEQLSADILQPLLQRLGQPISHLRIQAPIDWLKGIRLVDTPGVGDMMQHFDKQVHGYLSKADVLLYVMFSAATLSESERAFLTSSVMPQDFPKVFFIVNRLDELDQQNEQRLLKRTQKQISELFPNAYVFGISALDEFCRIQGSTRPNPDRAKELADSFQNLQTHLSHSVLLHKGIIQLERATDLMNQMLLNLETSMSMVKNAMLADKQKLAQAVATCEENTNQIHHKLKQHIQDIQKYIDSLSEETNEWMNAFITSFEEEAIPDIPKFNLQDVQKHYHFFLSDLLRRAVNACLDEHSTRIASELDKALERISNDFKDLSYSDLFNLEVVQVTHSEMTWTNIDTVSLIMQLNGSETLFKIASRLILRKSKELEQSYATSQYAINLKANLYHLRKAVNQEIASLYTDVFERIETAIIESYQQAIESSMLALQQAKNHTAQDPKHIQDTKTGLTESLSLLSDTRSFLQSFKKKLWIEDSIPLILNT
ncbi:MAG: dynamin family protein [Cyanobacteria bacterium P01_D01_bin.56]